MQPEKIQDLEVLLGHSFRVKNFLVNALSHSSIKNEHRPSNERLEFLGDSVLGLIVSDALYRRFPKSDEGTLTRIKSQAVSRATLQRVATAMGLERFILVGKGVAKREIPGSLLGNLFEAIVGAIYLDSGLAASRKFILRHLDVVINEIVEDRAEKNYKSLLQHHCQREFGAVPSYRVLREAGPAHNRAFDVAVVVSGKEYGRARATAKKEAEQGAARAAMIYLKAVDENPNKTVRGAGNILRVGPDKREKRRKRGDKSGKKEEAKAQSQAADKPKGGETGPAHTPGAEKSSSRRSSSRRRRGGRGGKDKAAEKETAAAKEKAEEPSTAAATDGDKSDGGGGKTAKKKKTTRKRTKKKAAKKDDAAAKKDDAAPPADEGPVKKKKKKTRRGGRGRKKKTGDGGSGDG
jgi:ribonuclease-3